MNNQPFIAYDNQLVVGRTTYTFTVGADGTGSPLSGALLVKNPQIAILRTNATGMIQIEFDTPPDHPYGQGPHGIGYLGGFGSPQALILGAHRHDPARQRFGDGVVKLEYMDVSGWVTLLPAEDVLANVDQVSLHPLDYHTPDLVNDLSYKYRLTIYGLSANADVVLPRLFLGPLLTLPYMELGFDPQQEKVGGVIFNGGGGAAYEDTKWRKKKSAPTWKRIADDQADELYVFLEHIEVKRHYYWFWAPVMRPFEGHLMRHTGKENKTPIGAGMYRKWTLPQEEVV